MATTTANIDVAARDDLIIQRFSRYQVLLPLITAAASLLGAIAGGIYTVHSSKLSQADQQMTEWRGALQQVKFDEDNQITSAYLLASYQNTDHDEEARKLQITILRHATKTATFDIVFQKMLSDAASSKDKDPQEVVTDLLEVDRNLSERLQTLYTDASHNPANGQSNLSYDEFLKNPTPFFTASQQADLNRTLVLIWELDTFSNGMDCIWNSTSRDCPHFSKPLPDAKGMVLLNYSAPTFKTVKACRVQHAVGEDQYECD